MTVWRVRRLSTVGPGEVEPRRYSRTTDNPAFMALSDQAGAVYDVQADEQALDTEQVIAALRSGSLAKNDLVFDDGRWLSLDASPTFEEAALKARTRGQGRALFFGVVAVGVMLLMLAVMMLATAH